MYDLTKQKCVPCEGGLVPLKGEYAQVILEQLSEGWSVIDDHHLEKLYTFPNFVDALAFTNRVGAVAEEEGHHPDLYLTWGKVRITVYTHAIDGLSANDFILAAKCDQVLTNT